MIEDRSFEAELERLADRVAAGVVERARARRRAELEEALRKYAGDEPGATVVDLDRARERRRPA